MDEESRGIGFLASDRVLFCSRACALEEGRGTGYEVDSDEYDALIESGEVAPGTVCPRCGAEFTVSWPEREPS